MTRIALILAFVLAPGCVLSQDGDDMDLCGASGLQGLIGQTGDIADLLDFDGPARILPPGTAMTMDLRRERINIEIDEDNRISRIYCA